MNQPAGDPGIHQRAGRLCDAIEAELQRIARWDAQPLPASAYSGMGAFGANTMRFEQWLQFVLLPRLREIAGEGGEFPQGSMIADHAMRVFDGDVAARDLQVLLVDLDALMTNAGADAFIAPVPEPVPESPHPASDTVTLGDTRLPAVVYTLAGVLHQHAFEDLESHLQTFDTFLEILAPVVRPELANLLMKAARQCADMRCSARIETAARSIAWGRRAAEPYNHEEAMKRYTAELAKNFEESK
jgi:uncharacterized protein YqcC (DUF446 family)